MDVSTVARGADNRGTTGGERVSDRCRRRADCAVCRGSGHLGKLIVRNPNGFPSVFYPRCRGARGKRALLGGITYARGEPFPGRGSPVSGRRLSVPYLFAIKSRANRRLPEAPPGPRSPVVSHHFNNPDDFPLSRALGPFRDHCPYGRSRVPISTEFPSIGSPHATPPGHAPRAQTT